MLVKLGPGVERNVMLWSPDSGIVGIDDERFDELMAFLLSELKKALGGDLPEQGNLF